MQTEFHVAVQLLFGKLKLQTVDSFRLPCFTYNAYSVIRCGFYDFHLLSYYSLFYS